MIERRKRGMVRAGTAALGSALLAMALSLRLCLLVVLLVPALAQAATLDSPSPGLSYSGAGAIFGWKCQAEGELTIRFNGGDPIPLIYGTERPDVLDAGACPYTDVGFVAVWNWARLGDGTHTAVAYDDGKEFARATFRVTTMGMEFLSEGKAECVIWDFPALGDEAHFTWNTSTQHLELTEFYTPPPPPPPTSHDAWCLATHGHGGWNPIFSGHLHICDVPGSFSHGESVASCVDAISLYNTDFGFGLPYFLFAEYQSREDCVAALRPLCPEGILEADQSDTSASCGHDNHETSHHAEDEIL